MTVAYCVLQIHRWTGLTLGLLAVFMAVTGIGLVMRPQLEPVLYRDLMVVAPCTSRLPLDDLAARAREGDPGGVITYVWIAGAADRSTMMRFDDNASVYLDPCTGARLGQQHRYGGIFGSLERLHKWAYLHGDKPIDIVPGTGALVLTFVLVVGGIVIWRPRRRSARKSAVKLDPRLTRLAFTRNLHATTGIYCSVIILIAALTGLPQAFEWVENAICRISGSPEPVAARISSISAGGQVIAMEAAWQRARSLVPDPTMTVIHYGTKLRAPVEIYMIERDAPHADARTYVYLDAYNGEVLSFRPYADAGIGQKLIYWTRALHAGHVGGVLGQMLLLVGMLGVPVLGYTGIESYLRKLARRRNSAGRRQRNDIAA
jgi:uncharacterized iron-regulated membrane protein